MVGIEGKRNFEINIFIWKALIRADVSSKNNLPKDTRREVKRIWKANPPKSGEISRIDVNVKEILSNAIVPKEPKI